MAYKQVIIIRKDLKMRRGKEIAQGSHASMAFLLDHVQRNTKTYPEAHWKWMFSGQTKVCLQVDSEEELLRLYIEAGHANLTAHIIQDAGRTEFNGVKTYTALAIGPADEAEIDKITKELKLY